MSQNNNSPKILIVRLSALGDIVHAFPALMHLRRHLPQAHIGWALEKRFASLLSDIKEIDSIHPIERKKGKKQLLSDLKKIRQAGYTHVIDFQGLFKSAVVGLASGAAKRVGFGSKNSRELSWLSYNTPYKTFSDRDSITALNLGLANTLVNTYLTDKKISVPQGKQIEFPEFIAGETQQCVEKRLSAQSTSSGFAMINPLGAWQSKSWSVEAYAKLADRLAQEKSLAIILTCFGPERSTGEAIVEKMTSTPILMDDLSFLEQAELGRRAAISIGPDTGPLHLAHAAGGPTLYLFGATDGWRNVPNGNHSGLIQSPLSNADCPPCWKKTCPKHSSTRCMEAINVDSVFNKAVAMIAAQD